MGMSATMYLTMPSRGHQQLNNLIMSRPLYGRNEGLVTPVFLLNPKGPSGSPAVEHISRFQRRVSLTKVL